MKIGHVSGRVTKLFDIWYVNESMRYSCKEKKNEISLTIQAHLLYQVQTA
jgi:hypothetical protein